MTGRGKAAMAVLAAIAACGVPGTQANATATRAEYDSAIAAAEKAEAQAGALHNQWTSTEDTLKAAKAAAGKQDFDEAVAMAERAREMAQRSIEQDRQQQTAWQDEVVR